MPAYDPPMSLKEVLSKHPQLAEDPVHLWRAEQGIELIHPEPTPEELERIAANWELMDEEQKRISDEKSMELFGMSNADHLEVLKQASIHAARKATNTEPTPNQVAAGNYAHGKFKLHGLTVSLENPRGSTRSGTSKSGKKWSNTMTHDYGRFLGTVGADKDHVDVFIGPNHDSEVAFVVDQLDPDTGKFDEHKTLLGFDTQAAAEKGYLSNYEKGWKGLGKITAMTMSQLKTWLADGATHKPISGQTVKLSSVQLDLLLFEVLKDAHEKQAADNHMGLDTTVGAAAGGLLGALLGAMKAKAHNAELEEGHDPGEEQSVALNALGFGAGGAALGGGAGAALSLMRDKPQDTSNENRPFFENGKAQRTMVVPDWNKGQDHGQVDPENYIAQWYQHVDGGWNRVKERARQATTQSDKQVIADPGSRGRARMDTTTDPNIQHFNDMDPGPYAQPGMKRIGGELPANDPNKKMDYGFLYKNPLVGKYLTQLQNKINGLDDREVSQSEARNLLVGHEARHQYQGEQAMKFQSPVANIPDAYINVGAELTQAMGQLKAETAFLTGKLITSGKDFRQLLDETGVSDADPHKLQQMEKNYSPEGARMLHYMRTIHQEDPESYNRLIDDMDKHNVYNQLAAASPAMGMDSTKMAATTIPTTGPEAIHHALKNMNLDDLEKQQRAILAKGSKTKRGNAVRVLGIIRGLQRNELEPKDLMINKVPLLPPAFRPFNIAGTNTFIPGNANELYKDLDSYRKSYHRVRQELGEEGSKEAWANLQQAVKAVYGQADSPNPKTSSRGVSGFLGAITGNVGKYGWVNRKLLSKPQDSVGRATIIPNPDLNMDQVEIPHDVAWPAYSSHVQRRMVRSGMQPIDALRHIKDRSPQALKSLELEMQERPVLLSRSPVWHRFGIQASWPKLCAGDAIRISPLTATGFGADYDGDSGRFWLSTQIDLDSFVGVTHVSGMATAKLKTMCCDEKCISASLRIQDLPVVNGSSKKLSEKITEYDVVPGIKALSYDTASGEIAWSPITKMSVHTGVTLHAISVGSETFLSSADHSLLAFSRKTNRVEKIRPLEAVTPGSCEFNWFAPVSRTHIVETCQLHELQGPSGAFVPADWELGFAIGVYAGDGAFSISRGPDQTIRVQHLYLYGGAVESSSRKKITHMRAATTFLNLFGLRGADPAYNEYGRESLGGKVGQSGRTSLNAGPDQSFMRAGYEWLTGLCGEHAEDKKFPASALSMCREFRWGLFCGIMASDGTVSVTHGKAKPQLIVGLNSITSEQMASDFVALCQSLGIGAGLCIAKRKTSTGKTEFSVTVSTADLAVLYRANPFSIGCATRDAVLVEHLPGIRTENTPDKVPYPGGDLGSALKDAFWELSGSPRLAIRNKRDFGASASWNSAGAWHRQVMTEWLPKLAEKLLSARQELKAPLEIYWRTVMDTSISWAEIKVSTTTVEMEAYDITVPGPLTFATSGGVFVQDTMTMHVPATKASVDEAIEKLMPSKMPFSIKSQDKIVPALKHEQVLGLYEAQNAPAAKTWRFDNKEDAMAAIHSGTVSLSDDIEFPGMPITKTP